MFYKLDEKNNILASASFQVDNTYIRTDKEIVRGFDGRLYFKGDEPKKSLDQLKQEKINQLKENCRSSILAKYSLEKQQSIANHFMDYTEKDSEKMKAFMSKMNELYKQKKKAIQGSNSEDELKAIDIILEFNED